MATEYRFLGAGYIGIVSGRAGAPRPEIGIWFQVGKQTKAATLVLTPKRALEVAERLIAAASRELVEREVQS